MFIHALLYSAILLASSTAAQSWGGSNGNGWSQASGSAANAVASWTRTQSSWAAASSPPGTVLVQVVQVSNANGSALEYFPDHIRAPAGSFVQFQFHPKNHTVTQSSFGVPCVPIAAAPNPPSNITGFKSGFMPVSANDTSIPVFTVQVNDSSTPIWIYCGQPGHCQKGMSMVINEQHGSNKTLKAYKAAAALLALPSMASSGVASVASTSTAMVMATTSAVATTTSSSTSSSASLVIASGTTSAGPAPFTGAARREEAAMGLSGLAGLVVAGLAFVL